MSVVAFLALFAVAVAWFLLPLLPALRELLSPTDAEPLTAVGQDAGDLTVFADGFRDYLARQLPTAPSSAPSTDPSTAASRVGTLVDGTPFVQLAESAELLREVALTDGSIPRVVIAERALTLPGGETFPLEVLARGPLRAGKGTIFRALLGMDDLTLGAGSEILRWVHADGTLRLAEGCTVHGRASATARILLGPDVAFSRIRAAHIAAVPDPTADDALALLDDAPSLPPVISGTARLPAGTLRERGYTRVPGDLTIPAGGTVTGALVVQGRLSVGEGARVGGSVKVHGECTLAADAVIDGTLVSRRGVTLGARCLVQGSIVAEGDVVVGSGSWVGSPSTPASIAAVRVTIRSGAQVFGAISARLGAQTG
ncbi:MAG: polymer-forming cytoskeletal protein [Gemmatimonadaceae bacterium]|nr:polymer-forming cytoskeletal protein [Gemmatimonadaceae bacterium]